MIMESERRNEKYGLIHDAETKEQDILIDSSPLAAVDVILREPPRL